MLKRKIQSFVKLAKGRIPLLLTSCLLSQPVRKIGSFLSYLANSWQYPSQVTKRVAFGFLTTGTTGWQTTVTKDLSFPFLLYSMNSDLIPLLFCLTSSALLTVLFDYPVRQTFFTCLFPLPFPTSLAV